MSMIINRIKKNQGHLKKWATREKCTAYRVYDKDIPEYPYAVDLYNDSIILYQYARGKRPEWVTEKEDEEQATKQLLEVVHSLIEHFEIPDHNLFVKKRERQAGSAQYEKLETSAHTEIVSEGGLKFLVNLSDYLDSGLFLDHRKTRSLVRSMVKGKSVLNLYSYTGSVSVYAASGGASVVTSVDLSNTYTEWAEHNMKLNQLYDERFHKFIRDDVTVFLDKQIKIGEEYDFIFVDPPSFSNSKKMSSFFDLQKHHVELLERCLSLLAPDGVVFFSNNLRSFKMDEAFAENYKIENITEKTLTEDFRNKRIHNAWLIRK